MNPPEKTPPHKATKSGAENTFKKSRKRFGSETHDFEEKRDEKKREHERPYKGKSMIAGLRPGSIMQGYLSEILVKESSNALAGAVKVRGQEVFLETIPEHAQVGDVVAFKLIKHFKRSWLGSFIRFVEESPVHVGVFYMDDRALHPIHRKRNFNPIPCSHALDDQSVVIFEEQKGVPVIKEILGKLNDPATYSKLSAIHHDVWYPVTEAEKTFCEGMKVPELGDREDLRTIPLVTIDGFDARDFDDAVFAQKDEDPANEGGYKLIVAIADVSFYVHKGDVLDAHASERGNSVYFPDYVLPMLPEALSNDLCSLRPFVERACIACYMTMTKNGRIKSFRFARALMKSHARLTYEEVEKTLLRGKANKNTEPVLTTTLLPIFEAYKLLKSARDERGSLELESDEHQIIFDETKEVKDIELKKSLTAHKIIEEFMVAANVAAAKALSHAGWPCIYRIHDKPDPIRLQSMKTLLKMLNLPTIASDNPSPKELNRVLAASKGTPYAQMVNTLVLRSQAQAQYSPNNIGHFGLNLQDYGHFTSPIRRYSDLIVHRLLVEKYKLGEGGFAYDGLVEISEHISKTERRAAMAEREAKDRFMARYLSQHIGEEFSGIIVGVNNAGLFISLDKNHAEGFLPKRFLLDAHNTSSSYFDAAVHMLRVGKTTYHLGLPIHVKVLEADPTLCDITFAPVFAKKSTQEKTRKFSKKHPGEKTERSTSSKKFPRKKV